MRVLYLEGDPGAIKYVSGTLTRLGVSHEVARPGGPLPRDLSHFKAVILSDFPRAHLHGLERLIVQGATHDGLGLFMIGGWRSFGRGGYADSDLGNLLPVTIEHGDDRVNLPSGMVLAPLTNHPILRGLQWNDSVVVTGHNRVHARPGTTTVLGGRAIETTPDGVRLASTHAPLLIVREAEGTGGRTAALATDLAPRWSGGLTDWGTKSIAVDEDEEVGEEYAAFVMNLVRWVAGEETIRRPVPAWEELAELPALEISPAMRCSCGHRCPQR